VKDDWGYKMNHIEILEVLDTSDTVIKAMNILLPQLTSKEIIIDEDSLNEIVKSESTRLMIVIDGTSENRIIGTYSIVMFRIPTGSVARIEDVVVDKDWRGKGIGKLMMNHAIEFAKKSEIIKIELTSHQARVEANNLYKSLGFALIETNVYRYLV
jgi:GNAT superfamily N-acetyltransferase